MRQHNAENERVKREYLIYLKAAKGRSEASLDTVVKAILRFEVSTKFRSLRKFHVAQAVAFRRQLSETDSSETGKPLSKATVLQTLNALRAFFLAGWTTGLPVADQLFRRGLLPPFRKGHADRHSPARTAGANSGANPGRARRHAALPTRRATAAALSIEVPERAHLAPTTCHGRKMFPSGYCCRAGISCCKCVLLDVCFRAGILCCKCVLLDVGETYSSRRARAK